MDPVGAGGARCPACGAVDPLAARFPLFVVGGASGSGKTTLLAPLIAELHGTCVVVDGDWLIDPLGRQPGVREIDWPSLRDMWLHIAHGLAQNDLPLVLLAPFLPDQLVDLPGRRWVGDIHFLVLDCPDEERRRRLAERPRWRGRDHNQQIEFARWLRANLSPVVDTSGEEPAATARVVADWVRGCLDHP